MTRFHATPRIGAPRDVVWRIVGDGFGDLAAWAPMFVRASRMLDGAPRAGAHRECELPRPFAGMTHITEEVVAWREGEGFTYRVLEPPKGVRRMQNTWTLQADGDGTLVTLEPEIEPEPPLSGLKAWLGWHLQFKPLIRKAMRALEGAVEGTGQRDLG